MVPLNECKHRYLYKIHSRNLSVGVFDKERSCFIGIREKLGARYLFAEYHWECEAFGTVKPESALEKLPDDIALCEHTNVVDKHRGRRVYFDKPVSEGGKGWLFVDDDTQCKNCIPVALENKPLFEWLALREVKMTKIPGENIENT